MPRWVFSVVLSFYGLSFWKKVAKKQLKYWKKVAIC